ncbi:hypothetical protein F5Y19DRAFT_436855 [Xylariaceae sp. FL1651]|nr:hypothetical protein F5Y19DRAFT_436855 [Xylariaceae sp. FL1651]
MSKRERATEFERIINEGRERKRNEDLAARIFSKDSQRRSSAPFKAGTAGSLASRVGVKKRISSGARIPAGNINGDWTHDLHRSQDGQQFKAPQQPATNSLAARARPAGTTLPKTRPVAPNARSNRTNKLANAFTRTTASATNAQQQMNVFAPPAQPVAHGITIKGLAGPFAVLAQNFAPGTTAADIESALTPVGGLISSCRLVKSHPIVIAEIVFESKEGADRVIQTFDKQTADGRTLSVYMKPGGYSPTPPTGPRSQRTNETRLGGNSVLVDGSMGFNDPIELDDGNRGLYSDNMVPAFQANGNGNGNANGRRDRSFRHGR